MVIIGTVRRFLEHYSDQVELIVFAVQTDHVSYLNLLIAKNSVTQFQSHSIS